MKSLPFQSASFGFCTLSSSCNLLNALNFHTVGIMSFHLSTITCNRQTHLALPLYLLWEAHGFHFHKSPDFCEKALTGWRSIWRRHQRGKYCKLYVTKSSVSSLDEDGQERFLHQGRCRTHCPRGLYPDRGHYACLPCIANCELCTDSNICAKCRERYKLQNGVCQTASCDIGKM